MQKHETVPIGEIVNYRGVKLQVTRMIGSPCYRCYFNRNHDFACYGTESEVGYCTKEKRDDNNNIVFKKIDI